ncbi:MAG: adenine nucleotide alpha hydrolase [Myxococcota bacterium]|jgi:uncharacterized protein (TIGR00290 family)|nr:adenine nucleotide alpha hydrolase [Myxococcota bacterium]
MPKPKALIAWSTGKDAAMALQVARESGDLEIVGLLTTVTKTFDRVSMHGVRRGLLEAQARAAKLPLTVVEIPSPCTNEDYAERMGQAMHAARDAGVEQVVFGDLFLEDIRRYREAQLATVGMSAAFPLWGRDTRALARELIASGYRAVVTCVDPKVLEPSFAGRSYDAALLQDLPVDVDPCGENGELHSFVWYAPYFDAPIEILVGETVLREGFAFADVLHISGATRATRPRR